MLKSADFFESPIETLQTPLEFLGLPGWEPEASQLGNKGNAGSYKGAEPGSQEAP